MDSFPWMIFFILLAGGLLATAAIIPYSLTARSLSMAKINEQLSAKGKRPLTLTTMLLISLAQGGLLVAVAAFVGLLAARADGLTLPILQALVSGQPALGMFLNVLPIALLYGAVISVILLALEGFYFRPRLPKALAEGSTRIPFWQRCMACFYGGFVEEILLRLFMMGGLAWLIGLVWKSAAGTPAVGALWLANILASLLFGAGHLPTTKAITPLTPLVVFRALLLNGLAGIVFGFLYMHYGLETAMLTHFTLDIAIHLVYPALQKVLPLQPGKAETQPA